MVSDTGCGIDADAMERIFEPYFTTREPGEGTGLGLATADGVVRGCGGAIRVASRPGAGTRFCLFFPILAYRQRSARPARGAAADVRPAPRLLFVDDEEMIARLAKQSLERIGYQVDVHTDPRRALEAFRQDPQRYDLLLTDETMPGLSGSALARQILQIRPGLPIILLTGHGARTATARQEPLGIRAVVAKPIDVQDLSAVIERALDRNGRERQWRAS
jgi:CheY-like chemotaxis protein